MRGRAGAEAGVFCALPFCADVLRRGVRGPDGLRVLLSRLGVLGLLAFRFAGVLGGGVLLFSSSFSLSEEEGVEGIGGLAIVLKLHTGSRSSFTTSIPPHQYQHSNIE